MIISQHNPVHGEYLLHRTGLYGVLRTYPNFHHMVQYVSIKRNLLIVKYNRKFITYL